MAGAGNVPRWRQASGLCDGSPQSSADERLLHRPSDRQRPVRTSPVPAADLIVYDCGVYADVYRTTMRVLYHKRDTALTVPYADPGFARAGIDDLLDAVFHPVLADYLLTHGEQPFAFKPITKGWYDAGDCGQYIHNAASVWPAIALALDLAPANLFADGELGIPESGNGVPDILDELR